MGATESGWRESLQACCSRAWSRRDIRQYFASIDHDVLKGLLARRFKDPDVLALCGRIIASHVTAAGRGLPIGNLTSQHFANHYLNPLDRFSKETLGRKAYVRYMDDFVVWGSDREDLKAVRDRVRLFLIERLKLELKPEPAINRANLGMNFLGCRLFPGRTLLARRSKARFTRKFRRYEAAHAAGAWTELTLQQRMQVLLAFVMPADSRGFRLHVFERFGVAAKSLEPRETRRRLEQQREQLPRGESQQQQAGQREQQPRLPFCPARRSTEAPDGASG